MSGMRYVAARGRSQAFWHGGGVFHGVVGAIASDLRRSGLEWPARKGQPLVEQLEAIAQELIQQVDGLSIQAACETRSRLPATMAISLLMAVPK